MILMKTPWLLCLGLSLYSAYTLPAATAATTSAHKQKALPPMSWFPPLISRVSADLSYVHIHSRANGCRIVLPGGVFIGCLGHVDRLPNNFLHVIKYGRHGDVLQEQTIYKEDKQQLKYMECLISGITLDPSAKPVVANAYVDCRHSVRSITLLDKNGRFLGSCPYTGTSSFSKDDITYLGQFVNSTSLYGMSDKDVYDATQPQQPVSQAHASKPTP